MGEKIWIRISQIQDRGGVTISQNVSFFKMMASLKMTTVEMFLWDDTFLWAGSHSPFHSMCFCTTTVQTEKKYAQNSQNGQNVPFWAFRGAPKMKLREPKSKFLDHFSIQIPPLKPLFRHFGNHFGPPKSDFQPFCTFCWILVIFTGGGIFFWESVWFSIAIPPS